MTNECCIIHKLPKSSHSRHGECAKGILEFIYSKVYDLMPVQAKGGNSYFITFTNDFLRSGWVYLIRYKSKAF